MVVDVVGSGTASWWNRWTVVVPALLVLAVTVGVAPLWLSPIAVAAAVAVVVASVRFGLVTTLLHGLVLSMFFESLTVGSSRLGRVLAVAVVLVLLLRLFSGWRPAALPRLGWVPALAFLTWNWASGFWAGAPSAWQDDMGALALAAAYFLAFALLVTSPAQMRQLLRTYVLGAGVMSFVALAQAAAHIRAVGFQGDPNIFALYQVAAIPAAGMLSRTTKNVWTRLGWLLVIIPLVASVIAAQSRGGLVTLALLMPVCLARGDFGRIRRGHGVLSLVTAAAVLAAVGLVAHRYGNRFSVARVLQDRGTGRLDIWHVALRAYLEHPLLGLGAGGFQPLSGHLLETTPGVGLDRFSTYFLTGIRVHDTYLESLTELGPIGLLTWLAILVSTAVLLVRVAGGRVRATPTSALLPMLGAFAVATIFLSVNNNKMLWMVIGLAAAAGTSVYASASASGRRLAGGRVQASSRTRGTALSGDSTAHGPQPEYAHTRFAYDSPAAPLRRSSSRSYQADAPGPAAG